MQKANAQDAKYFKHRSGPISLEQREVMELVQEMSRTYLKIA
jgi:hypothetical protein